MPRRRGSFELSDHNGSIHEQWSAAELISNALRDLDLDLIITDQDNDDSEEDEFAEEYSFEQEDDVHAVLAIDAKRNSQS
jgi:hypothetical protein